MTTNRNPISATDARSVACLDVFEPEVRNEIQNVAGDKFAIRFAESEEPREQMELIENAEFILLGGARLDAEMIAHAGKARLIQKWGIGVDKIDLDAARKASIPVAITFGANASPVAELAVLLMLAVYRRLPLIDRKLREGVWMKPQLRATCYQISGKTVGLVGFGNIARMTAHRLRGFDAKIIYHDPRQADRVTERALDATHVSFDELLERSDIISLHTPLNAATHEMINAESIARMKTGAILVNTARGELIDEASLVAALESGKLRGAGLDTFVNEPPKPDNPLLKLDQVVVTPHGGGGTFDNVANVARHAIGNMQRLLDGNGLAPEDVIVTAP